MWQKYLHGIEIVQGKNSVWVERRRGRIMEEFAGEVMPKEDFQG